MPSFKYISRRGDVLNLINNDYFDLINIDGQTVGTSSISSVVTGGIDGDDVTNLQAQPRTIILDLRIKSDVKVETAKREILKVIKLKQYGTIVWEQDDRTVTLSGLVESIDLPRWNNAPLMQVTLYCEQPFWEDIEDAIQEINEFIDLHYFTNEPPTDLDKMLIFPEDGVVMGEFDTSRAKTFTNAGDVAVGLEIRMTALKTVTNPIIKDTYGNYFGLNMTLQAGDNVVITTHKGNKRVYLNEESNTIYDKIMPNSTWLQMDTGDNQFSIDSDDNDISNMIFNLIYKQRYI